MDAEQPGEDGGGQVGAELEQRGGAGLARVDAEQAQASGHAAEAEGMAGLAAGKQPWRVSLAADDGVPAAGRGELGDQGSEWLGEDDRLVAEPDAHLAAAGVDEAGGERSRPRLVGVASQHRVYAALREFCNFEVRKTRRMWFNPVYAVELEPEEREEAQRWSAEQAAHFLAAAADDPLGLLFRIVVLRGARRAEVCGFRWSRADLDAGYLAVARTLLLVGAHVIEGKPKSQAGERKIWLDEHTIALLREHRKQQLAARLAAGTAWQDHDLVFCKDDGTPWKPDYVSRRFKAIARAAGLPVIKLHEGRHSAASLARDAEVDPEIRRKTLGHADQAMTSHYTHIEAQAHRAAAEAVAKLVEGDGS